MSGVRSKEAFLKEEDREAASASYTTRLISLSKHVVFFAGFVAVCNLVSIALPSGQ